MATTACRADGWVGCRFVALFAALLGAPRAARADDTLTYFNQVVVDPSRLDLRPAMTPDPRPLTDEEKRAIGHILMTTPSIDGATLLSSLLTRIPVLNGKQISRYLLSLTPDHWLVKSVAASVASFVNVEERLRRFLGGLEAKLKYSVVYHTCADTSLYYRPESAASPRSFTLYVSVHLLKRILELQKTYPKVPVWKVVRFLSIAFGLEAVRRLVASQTDFLENVFANMFKVGDLNLSYALAAAYAGWDLEGDGELIKFSLNIAALAEDDLFDVLPDADPAVSVVFGLVNKRITAFYNNYPEVLSTLKGDDMNIATMKALFDTAFDTFFPTPKPVAIPKNQVMDTEGQILTGVLVISL